MKRTFKCDWCKETFEIGWSEKEALTEKQANFGDMSMEEMVRLCDDCFEAVMAFHGHEGFTWDEEKHRPIQEKGIELLMKQHE